MYDMSYESTAIIWTKKKSKSEIRILPIYEQTNPKTAIVDCDGSAIVGGGGVKGEMVGGSAVLEGIYSGLHCFSPESTAQYFIHKRLRY